ncbi:MAG: hypothetical protein V2A56_13480 [bacterium]
MARVRVDDLVEALEQEMKSALGKTVEELWPDLAPVDRGELLRTFRRILRGQFRDWTHVPDKTVDNE